MNYSLWWLNLLWVYRNWVFSDHAFHSLYSLCHRPRILSLDQNSIKLEPSSSVLPCLFYHHVYFLTDSWFIHHDYRIKISFLYLGMSSSLTHTVSSCILSSFSFSSFRWFYFCLELKLLCIITRLFFSHH